MIDDQTRQRLRIAEKALDIAKQLAEHPAEIRLAILAELSRMLAEPGKS